MYMGNGRAKGERGGMIMNRKKVERGKRRKSS